MTSESCVASQEVGLEAVGNGKPDSDGSGESESEADETEPLEIDVVGTEGSEDEEGGSREDIGRGEGLPDDTGKGS